MMLPVVPMGTMLSLLGSQTSFGLDCTKGSAGGSGGGRLGCTRAAATEAVMSVCLCFLSSSFMRRTAMSSNTGWGCVAVWEMPGLVCVVFAGVGSEVGELLGCGVCLGGSPSDRGGCAWWVDRLVVSSRLLGVVSLVAATINA